MPRKRRPRQQLAPAAVALLILLALLAWWQQRRAGQPSQRADRQSQTAPAGAGDVRIATWNLKQFSQTRRADLRAIATIIGDGGFDLVALQEVKGDGDEIDRLLNTLGPPWRSTALSPKTGSNYERFAFLYRSDRLSETERPRLVDWEGPFDRRPYQASFRAGNFDFVLVSVHLSYTDVARRKREVESLAGHIRRTIDAGPERDILVLGDFNEERRRPNFGCLEDAGLKWLIAAATNLSSKETFDNIIMDPRITAEYTGRCGVVMFDEKYFANDDKTAVKSVSDHRPAWADFATTMADDD